MQESQYDGVLGLYQQLHGDYDTIRIMVLRLEEGRDPLKESLNF